MYKVLTIVCGMPRSGTSWLGQIFDSDPNIAFRMEPLFAYPFKNCIDESSNEQQIRQFFSDVYDSNDEFIHQTKNRTKGSYPVFEKVESPSHMVIKTTRHHELLDRYLKYFPTINIISIVRHPCAAMSSWIYTDNEFSSKGCVIGKDWRSGKCRKDGHGEYWGFNDWLRITRKHVDLASKYRNFHLIRYEHLLENAEEAITGLCSDIGMNVDPQTINFIKLSQSTDSTDPYAVFKNKDVKNKWKDHLDPSIAEKIIKETESAGLGDFLRG